MPIEVEKEFSLAPAPESYVYMFYSGGKVKIGTSVDPVRRLDQLSNSSSIPVQLVFVALGDKRDEENLHRQFTTDRIHGEWFTLSKQLRSFLSDNSTFSRYLKAAEGTWQAFQRASH